jgi:hypothetical protein
VAAALPSTVALVTLRNMTTLALSTNIFLNYLWMTSLVYIQSIGSGFIIYFLYIILINNIFFSIVKLIFINSSVDGKVRKFFGKILSNYMKIFFIYPNYILRLLFTWSKKFLDLLNNSFNSINSEHQDVKPLKLIAKEFDDISKHTLFVYENDKLLDHLYLLAALFAGLREEDEFKKIGQKVLLVSILSDDKTYMLHRNIIIDENTTIDRYLELIDKYIQAFYDSGYPLTTFNTIEVKMWDRKPQNSIKGKGKKDNSSNTIHISRRSFYTSCINMANKELNLIKPLKLPKIVNKTLIGTIDLETIEINNNQIPISISFSYFLNGEIITLFELIDYNLLIKDSDQAINLLWLHFMNKLNALNLHKIVIFSHNLGSFDGYFIFKGLLELPGVNIDKVNSIIDNLHRFISITINWKDTNIIFKDSLRIFPVSLQQLCDTFEVEGKLYPYNPLFNKISLFQNNDLLDQFIEYSKQDSISLLKALIKAQNIYIKEHKVDIASIWSTSTLSFKIFRLNFLNIEIPTLTNKLDSVLRLAYLGGSTDYYFKYGENLKHYDVNSLYPKAMCNPMPIKFLGELDGSKVRLENIFGFAEAKITTPKDLTTPLLPFKIFNETLHPLGSWIGIYFTEELKAISKYGYNVELIKVYSFSKGNIFESFIKYFYEIKKIQQELWDLLLKCT